MKYLLLITLTICVSACQSEKEYPDFKSIEEETTNMLMAFHTAVNQSGLMAEFEFLDSSKQFYWTPPGYSYAIEYDSIKNILIESSKDIDHVHFEWDTLDVFPLSSDYCNYRGIVDCRMVGLDSVSQEFKVLESGTLVRRSDGWRFLSGQSRVQ
ncbi:MAG: hypothetical protein HKN09_11325 [Saprospiraceae bacterium]|nr:hypothetical protein [Saprospiraceae bacterium]